MSLNCTGDPLFIWIIEICVRRVYENARFRQASVFHARSFQSEKSLERNNWAINYCESQRHRLFAIKRTGDSVSWRNLVEIAIAFSPRELRIMDRLYLPSLRDKLALLHSRFQERNYALGSRGTFLLRLPNTEFSAALGTFRVPNRSWRTVAKLEIFADEYSA